MNLTDSHHMYVLNFSTMFLALALSALLLLGLASLSLGFLIFAGFFQDRGVRWLGRPAQRRRL